ncbi:hypothetical protein CEXT_332741 [Caerostris extrusa]|uniref:Uncharacterized protein n=1 Tax=Caerostris extrusa TaxID=172846 RepID=A0AAV4WZL1_CAEEX|nr:hypothetical protein CEXT_332741 [Caerostris extrusa]
MLVTNFKTKVRAAIVVPANGVCSSHRGHKHLVCRKKYVKALRADIKGVKTSLYSKSNKWAEKFEEGHKLSLSCCLNVLCGYLWELGVASPDNKMIVHPLIEASWAQNLEIAVATFRMEGVAVKTLSSTKLTIELFHSYSEVEKSV